ncbi:MAG: 4-(cytidine 5'-diphospho)-2-C-methyl-D-erythritol kinase [Thermodesulfovibrionales bacterium]|nr:4-(cytidine 5'-diphospho)-2-C-methyl-D-erythritol kinase [Thermodesulfovibrionales bacterium]
MRLRAPAKINWFLTVLRKRDNGYHDIRSLMQCIRLYDDLLFNHADTLDVISDLDISLEDNLVYRAASLLKRHTSCKKGVKIILRKNIPVGAGLGGGSSDAAYTLLGLNKLWNLGLNNRELSLIGLEIGSDVPFFLNGPSAFVEGRGEKVTLLKINSSIVFLLVKPPVSVSTAWAYENVSELTKTTVDIKLFCQVLRKRDFAYLNTMLDNDLERVVVKRYPIVGEIKERLLERGAVISAMSGSGPTVFGVFGSVEEARKISKVFKDFWTAVVQTITGEN